MKRIVGLPIFAGLLLSPLYAQAESVKFEADSSTISAGSTATLRWTAPEAARIYLSEQGVIKNPKSGSMTVSPRRPTNYVMVFEKPDSTTVLASYRIDVTGSERPSGVWPTDPTVPLAVENNYDFPQALLDTAVKVAVVLQNRRKFEVKQIIDNANKLVFYTAYKEASDLPGAPTAPNRLRRIAFRVALGPLPKPPGVRAAISTSIQWRTIIDDRWFPENSSASNVFQDAISALETEIVK